MKNFYKYLSYLIYTIIIGSIIKVRIELYILVAKGLETDGYIIDIRSSGSKGDVLAEYIFHVEGKKHYSKSVNIENPYGGKLIRVVYLPSFPSINQPFEHLQKFK